jgi:Fe-S cluster assembly scaffold protein SufB
VAEDDSYVSYLEGCTAPSYDKNQLHAAVVELHAGARAEIKYSTVQNWCAAASGSAQKRQRSAWTCAARLRTATRALTTHSLAARYAGDTNGVGGIYNFVTKRGLCKGEASKISWTQVETGSAITWKYPSVVLAGDNSVGEFYSVALTNNYQQADTGTKARVVLRGCACAALRLRVAWARACMHGADAACMLRCRADDPRGQEHAQPHREQGHLCRALAQLLPRPRLRAAVGHRRAQLLAV